MFLDIHGVFLYTNLMITLKKQVQLKLKKFDELMIELKIKTKYSTDCVLSSIVYDDINKIDEKIQEISKLIDNNKD